MKEDKEFVCAQDLREQELQKLGYKQQKAYFRIGRAIFIVEPTEKQQTKQELLVETLQSPLGVCIGANEGIEGVKKLYNDPETMKMIQRIFMPTGLLKITVEGDPDGGIGNQIPNEILLSGYRYGLDDVFVDGRLLVTTHGSRFEILNNIAEFVDHLTFWSEIEHDDKTTKQIKATAQNIRKMAKALRKYRI